MSAALSGYIADGETHATKLVMAAFRTFDSHCGRRDSADLVRPVAVFIAYPSAPICRACVAGVESAHSAKGNANA